MDVKREGWLIEEYVTESHHKFSDGKYQFSDHDSTEGYYTGRFWFKPAGGKRTRAYTIKTAPKWLLKLYEEAVRE